MNRYGILIWKGRLFRELFQGNWERWIKSIKQGETSHLCSRNVTSKCWFRKKQPHLFFHLQLVQLPLWAPWSWSELECSIASSPTSNCTCASAVKWLQTDGFPCGGAGVLLFWEMYLSQVGFIFHASFCYVRRYIYA